MICAIFLRVTPFSNLFFSNKCTEFKFFTNQYDLLLKSSHKADALFAVMFTLIIYFNSRLVNKKSGRRMRWPLVREMDLNPHAYK